jgi:hypothetical protein
MRRISFNPRFVKKSGKDLIAGKIHTIRENYDWWKRFEGQEVSLFYWIGKPYRSKQKVFCVKRIISVQEVFFKSSINSFYPTADMHMGTAIKNLLLAWNDGFKTLKGFNQWFNKYKSGKMAIIHFTDLKYRGGMYDTYNDR